MQGQVAALNAQLQAAALASDGVNPAGFNRMTQAVKANSQVWRDAANSTGVWEASQVRVNKATDEYTRLLEKQRISFRGWKKNHDLREAAYRDQLRMQQMVARALPGMRNGKMDFDVAIPSEVHKSWDTLGNRIGWARENLRSMSTQMLNWGKNTQWAGRQLMVGLTLPIAAFGAAAGVMAYQLDQQLTRIAKVYDTTADANNTSMEGQMAVTRELDAVRKASMQTAIDMAQAYGAAAKDTLEIQAELAATGLNGARLQETTAEVMRVATLGELDHAEALNSTITLQTVFNQSTKELTESFNYMNAVENATSLQLKDFAAAIPIAAAPIKAFGGDVQELGILLTAMKERGIQATEGANALKAAMQRLGRPSKQVQSEFSAITGQDITKLVDQSSSLTEIFTKLNTITKDLSASQKRDVFAGLFGTYQVTRMTALVEGMGSLEAGVGQVSAAARIAEKDTTSWAEAADREIKRMQESVSMQFKSALETLKAELATLGEPFLKVGAFIMNAITGIIRVFNELPGPIKFLSAIGLGLLALSGPLIMIVGLFANFGANMIKAGVAMTGVLTRFKLLNENSAVAVLATELATRGFVSEATALQKLTVELQKVALAHEAAAAATSLSGNAAIRTTASLEAEMIAAKAAYSAHMNQPLRWSQVNNDTYRNNYIAKRDSLKSNAMYAEAHYMNRMFDEGKRKTGEIVENSKKTRHHLAGAAGSLVLAASSMALMSGTSNETVHNIANMALMAAFIIPAFGTIGTAISSWRTAQIGKDMANWKHPIHAAQNGVKNMGKGFLSLARFAGPAGLVAGGLGAIAYFGRKAREEAEKLTKEHEAQNRAIYDQNNLLQKSLDIQVQGAKKLSTISPTNIGGGISSIDLASELKKTDPNLVKGFADASEVDKLTIATQKYVTILHAVGGDAIKARKYIEALYIAAGDGALEAQVKASALYQSLGATIDMGETTKLWSDLITSTIGDSEKSVKEQGTKLGEILADAMAAGGRDKMDNTMLQFRNAINQSWDKILADMSSSDRSLLGSFGIGTGVELKNMIQDFENAGGGFLEGNLDFFDKYGATLAQSERMSSLLVSVRASQSQESKDILATESAIAAELARQLGITREIKTLRELQGTYEYRLQTVTKENAQELFDQQIQMLDLNPFIGDDELRTMKLMTLNQIRLALGMKETGKLADGFGRATVDVNGNLITQNQHIEKGNRALRNRLLTLKSITGAVIESTAKDAMSSFQQGIADATMGNFESNMEAAMSRVEAAGEARMDAFEANAERRQNGLEAMQEARRDKIENAYDSRIEKIQAVMDAEQKAEDLRKKLFEAEMTRIERLNAMANRNIDFNTALNEGNLDEAAKIQNDANAEYERWVLDDAAASGEGRSKRRQDRLQDRIDKIEEARDARLDALSKIEEAERNALQRSLEAERNSLEASIQANEDAERQKWETRREFLAKSLEDFTNYVAFNAVDLKKHIDEWNKKHQGLALVTQGRYEDSIKSINEFLRESISNSRKAIANDLAWEESGAKIARNMIKGAFGMSMEDFRNWMITGKWPKSEPLGKVGLPDKTGQGSNRVYIQHGGGWAGRSTGREGVARTTPGLHHSEYPTILRDGEFVVRREAALNSGPLLNAINSGNYKDAAPIVRQRKGEGGAGLGVAGLMAAGIGNAVRTAISRGVVTNGMKTYRREQRQRRGQYNIGAYGNRIYNLPGVKPWVAEAAQYLGNKFDIASILGVGYRPNYSEHPLGRALDFMTTDIGKGNALSAEVVRLSRDLDAMYVIWRQRINSLDGRGWKSMEDRGSPTANHMDHVHVSFLATGDTGDLPGMGGILGGPQGPGGVHRPINYPITKGIHDDDTDYPAVDMSAPGGTPVYAVGAGRIGVSTALRNPDGSYKSYGEYMTLNLDDGRSVLMAHLSQRNFGPGARVAGGTIIGRVGTTGHSTGNHLHFGAREPASPYDWTGLAKGAANINVPGLYNLHKNEAVLTEDINRQFQEGIKNFAQGPNSTYNLHMHVNGQAYNINALVARTMVELRKLEDRKPQSRRRA